MTVKVNSEKRIGGTIAIFIGMLSLYEAYRLYPFNINPLTGDHALPGLIGLLLVIVGCSLFFEKKTEENKSSMPTGKVLYTLIASIIILFIYCLLIKYFGYVVSTLAVSVLLLRVIAKNHWVSAFLIGGLVTGVLYYLFIVMLKTPFPSGIFPF